LKMHVWPPMAQAYVDFLKGTKINKYAIAINIRYKILSSPCPCPCPWTSYRKRASRSKGPVESREEAGQASPSTAC